MSSQPERIGRFEIERDEQGNLIELGAGTGYTARVYQALDTVNHEVVALKVMKSGLTPAWQERFKLEGDVLTGLRAAAADPEFQLSATLPGAEVDLPPDYSFIVGLRGMDLDHDPPYIALELLRSKTVEQLLMEQGPLEERSALRIGWQFCHALQLLHQGLGRSYTDMRLDDIWWDGQWIKVTDWNVVSEVGEADVTGDLLTLGKHLYHMVTGILLDPEEQGFGYDQLAGGAREEKKRERWQALSRGMQGILHRALHRNVSKRYADAHSLARVLWDLSQAWDTLADELALRVGKMLSGEPGLEQAARAAVLLDVARRRGDGRAEVIDRLTDEVEQRLSVGEEALRRGHRFWQAGDYLSAMEALQEAIEEGKEELAAWRLLGLARLGTEQVSQMQAVQDRLDEGLRWLTDPEWHARAEKLFGQVAERLGGAGAVLDLQREAQTRRWVELAEAARPERQWGAAAKAYATAWDAVQGIEAADYREALVSELPDLQAEARQARARAVSEEEAAKLMEAGRVYLTTNVGQAAGYLRRGLGKDPDNQAILDLCREQTLQLARQGRLEEALVMCETALGHAPSPGTFSQLWRALHRTRDALASLRSGAWWHGIQLAESLFVDYLTWTSGDQERRPWQASLLEPMLAALRIAFQNAAERHQYDSLASLLVRWRKQYAGDERLLTMLDQCQAVLFNRLDQEAEAAISDLRRSRVTTLAELRGSVEGGEATTAHWPPQYRQLAERKGAQFAQVCAAREELLDKAERLWVKLDEARSAKRWPEAIDSIRELEELGLSGIDERGDLAKSRNEAEEALARECLQHAQDVFAEARSLEDLDGSLRHLEEAQRNRASARHPMQREIRSVRVDVERARKSWLATMAEVEWADRYLKAAARARTEDHSRCLLEAAEERCQQVLESVPCHRPTLALMEQIREKQDQVGLHEAHELIILAQEVAGVGAFGHAQSALERAGQITIHDAQTHDSVGQLVSQTRQQLADVVSDAVRAAREKWSQGDRSGALLTIEGLRGIEQSVPWPVASGSETEFDVERLVGILEARIQQSS